MNVKEKAAYVADLLRDVSNPISRASLLFILGKAIAYHRDGKIEGIHSLDVACSNCDFCQRMQASDDPRIICRLCYTLSMWGSAKQAHAITGDILSSVKFTTEELKTIATAPGLIRINSDGELINATHAANIVRFASAHPHNVLAIWTKRPEILDGAIKREGKPANLICGISSPLINCPARTRYSWIDFVFTVYTPTAIGAAIARGERECNGRKCMDCEFKCYKHSDKPGPVFVAELLRKPRAMKTADFSVLVAQIDELTMKEESEK